jgi:hypothetical protein
MASTKSILINGTNQGIIHNNVIVMDIENLLTGWPTYEIKFMPKNPGPLVSDLNLFILLANLGLETYHLPQGSRQDGPHQRIYQ